MAEEQNCNNECSSCAKSCGQRDFRAKLHEQSSVKKVIGVLSGKGGVGKSFVTCLLACAMNRKGKHTAILDADITGPSIPEAFGLSSARAEGDEQTIHPVTTDGGIQLMSMDFLLESNTDPVVWRGPVTSGAVKQFWTDEKAVKMAQMMKIPILGLVENMSYVKCPKCGEIINVYGKSNIEAIAKNYNIPVLAKIPIEEQSSAAVDLGTIEDLNVDYVDRAIDTILAL